MGQNPTDSHLEGKSPWRDSNLRPLAWSNNLLKVTLGGQLAQLIIEGKVTLLDDASKPLAKVDSSGDHDSEDEETYENDDYDFHPYDDDMYEGQDIPDKIQATCDNLDIKVRGPPIANKQKRQSLGLVDEEDNDVTNDVSGGGKKWHVRELSDDFYRVGTKKRVMEMEGEARNRGRKVAITKTVKSGLKGGGGGGKANNLPGETYKITYNVPNKYKYNKSKVFQGASNAEDVLCVFWSSSLYSSLDLLCLYLLKKPLHKKLSMCIIVFSAWAYGLKNTDGNSVIFSENARCGSNRNSIHHGLALRFTFKFHQESLITVSNIPLAKVDSSGDHNSEDEVASVDNEMTNFLASKKVGYGQDIPDKIQATCDNLDIKVRGPPIANKQKRQSLGLVDEEDNDVTDDVSGGGKKWHVRELSDDFHRVGTKKRVMEMEGEARNRGRKVAITKTVQSGLKGGGGGMAEKMMKMFKGKGIDPSYISSTSQPHADLRVDWIMDTGASDHMSPHLHLFHSIRVLKKPIKIRLPDGTSKWDPSTSKVLTVGEGYNNLYICKPSSNLTSC
ncbi:hypothetical protein Tco_1438075 [Tanacetum coccineum]